MYGYTLPMKVAIIPPHI